MMRRLFVISILASSLAVLPAAGARADDDFTFFGSGWGHGVGMSQWGAYGLALDGWKHDDILKHYYTGVTLGAPPSAPSQIRVGLIRAQSTIELKAQVAKVELRVGNPNTGTLIGEIPKGVKWTIGVAGGKYEVLNSQGERVGGQLWGGPGAHVFARYVPNGARVYVLDTLHTYNRGYLELNLYDAGSLNLLRLIAVMPPQHYLFGVAEVYSGWPEEALKTQAIAARTYAFKLVAGGQHKGMGSGGCNCGIEAGPINQVYFGWDKEGGDYGENWVAAVTQTAGKAILYDGSLIFSYFHASSGGFTEDVSNVWGGSYPYLVGVCDPGVWASGDPNKTWTVGPMTKAAVTAKLKPYTGDIGVVQWFSFLRGVSGRIVTATAHGTGGRKAVVQDHEFKDAFDLKDVRVWVNVNKNITGDIREKYDDLDCAPGKATTAIVPIKDGKRQRYEDGAIYQNLIRGVVRWLHGPIYEKYRDMGEAPSVLSVPVTGILRLKATDGSKAKFEGGSIYWSSGSGAHALWGAVLAYYAGHGAAAGSLGLPTSDVSETGDGGTTASFQNGTVTCDAGGVCTQS
jgi:SpoIID/LytB domain protein